MPPADAELKLVLGSAGASPSHLKNAFSRRLDNDWKLPLERRDTWPTAIDFRAAPRSTQARM